ncbi:tripartite tricarboxylate transporter substrate binding protein [Cryobacterium sp. TMT1-2-2]|uniref:tripartite tricarboxylate transporter substrate binding protein n=1 Tax=Cryobacterium sp. TMT1-2-2 TaxID=1259233 RepID=UPI0018E09AA5|nr:tripartite tricarboxylate transporter substrate binding protein [Cryobacterium sp. TMT1-2-2]
MTMRSALKKNTAIFLPAITGLAMLGLLGCSAAGAAGSPKAEDDYPSKPVTFVVPFAAGGPSTVTALAYASCLEEGLGQTFVVENQPGGSGGLAMQDVSSAKPDGYTLTLGTNGPLVMNPMINKLNYNLEDFTSIGVMAQMPTVLVVGAESPYESAEEFFAAAKKNPGKLSVAIPGATTSAAIELGRLSDEYDIDVTAIPAAGNAEMTTSLLGGHVDALFITDHQDVQSRIDDGSFVPLAVSSPERADWYANVPTLAEQGFPDLVNAVSVFGVVGPKGMPDDIVSTLEAELKTCSEDPKVVDQVGKMFVPAEFGDAAALDQIFADMQKLYEPILGQE